MKHFRKHKKRSRKTRRGGSFKSVLGTIGNVALHALPLVLSALGFYKDIFQIFPDFFAQI